MAHNCIFEIRKGEKFSTSEIEKGTMNVALIHEWHPDLFDYISDDYNNNRDNDIQNILMSRIGGAFSRNGDLLTLSQKGFDTYIENWVSNIRDVTKTLNPMNFANESIWVDLHILLPVFQYGSVYIFDKENEGDIVDWKMWLLYSSMYKDPNGDGRKFYIGKIWDYHF